MKGLSGEKWQRARPRVSRALCRSEYPHPAHFSLLIQHPAFLFCTLHRVEIPNPGSNSYLAPHLLFSATNRLDRTIHRSGSSAAFEIPIRGVTATSASGTRSPSRIRSGDEISDAP